WDSTLQISTGFMDGSSFGFGWPLSRRDLLYGPGAPGACSYPKRIRGRGIPRTVTKPVEWTLERIPMNEPRIRAVVFREGDWWIIQLLEYDLATQVRRLEDVPSEFRRLILGQMEANAALGVEPFYGFSRAPKRFWEMYERARTLVAPTSLEGTENKTSPQYEARLAA